MIDDDLFRAMVLDDIAYRHKNDPEQPNGGLIWLVLLACILAWLLLR